MSKQQAFAPDDRERVGHKRRTGKKTFIVEWKAKPGRSTLFFRDWSKFGAYHTLAQAQQCLRAKEGDRYFDYRLRG